MEKSKKKGLLHGLEVEVRRIPCGRRQLQDFPRVQGSEVTLTFRDCLGQHGTSKGIQRLLTNSLHFFISLSFIGTLLLC